MKKSVDDFVRPVQERKNESLPSQKPGNEKPKDHPWSLERQESGSRSNDFHFRDSVKDEKKIPVRPDSAGDRKYAPTEKPW